MLTHGGSVVAVSRPLIAQPRMVGPGFSPQPRFSGRSDHGTAMRKHADLLVVFMLI
jgi:hypothetical protein